MNTVTNIAHLAPITPPSLLRYIPGWLIWRYEPNGDKKPRKVPYYATGGKRYGQQGKPEDRAQLTTFDTARASAARRGFDGVGFALLHDFGVVALDFDDCVGADGIHPDILPLVSTTYAEYSPSGKGIRAFFRGALGNLKDHGAPFGFEVFSSSGYCTFTGNVLDVVEIMGNADEVAPVDDTVMAYVQSRFKRQVETRDTAPTDSTPIGLTETQIEDCLDVLPTDLDYDAWIQVGMALHHETQGQGFDTWDAWSQRSPKYASREYGLERWQSFGKGNGQTVTARSLVRLANEHGAHVTVAQAAALTDFDVIATEQTPAEAPKRARFRPVPFAEFSNRPAPRWIIKGVLPQAELVVLFGESGSGKSFVALDMAASIARGIAWRGRRVRQGRVVYIAAEGAGGFRNRCVAYARHHQLDDLPLEIIADTPNFLTKDDPLAVARAIGKADVVVVDTFAQVTPGGNENAGEDMGKALSHCKGIHRATGAVVLLVHHSGKDASKGARGWSGIRAAADAELEVTRGPAGRQLRTSKQKDGDDDLAWGFGLEVVELGVDEDGDAITSCIVTETAVPVARQLRTLGAVESVVNDVLQDFAKSSLAGIEVPFVVEEAVRRLPSPEDGKRDTRKMRIKRAIESLTTGDDALFMVDDDGTISVL